MAVKITAPNTHGRRVLPVYYDANSVTLLRGKHRGVVVRCPRRGSRCARITLSGLNVQPVSVTVGDVVRSAHAR